MLNYQLPKGLFLLVGLFISTSTLAETVSLEYVGFYDRLKQVNKKNYPLAELAFSVPITDDCKILSGNITTENETFPLTYTKAQRLFIPFDAQLKSDRALVNINVQGDPTRCAIAMQVRARSTQNQYTQTQLLALRDDMNRLLDGLQGFPMKYFRKPIDGMTFEFMSQEMVITIDGIEQTFASTFALNNEQINQLTQISFSEAPSVVSPLVLNQ
ncbi:MULTISPECIES: DUF2987 domain-containing protein [Shewanella]|uniref:DUF2987 domain-containing protein n=1 Tax=Shewanella TaxID=22 RepID=UPI00200D43CE|nr:DUF2987 domain-containing protein [Shewanella basaltis]MCL1112833.1 DUF2987 domain-containing protein [Shewanella basaltis]